MSDNQLNGVSILLVEDDPLLTKRIASRLSSFGLDVTAATTLASAKEFLKSLDFDVILLDVHLPDGLGTDLLKEELVPQNTGSIVMTSKGAVEGAVEAMQLGASNYLVKPFEPAELAIAIRRTLQNKKSKRVDQHQRASMGELKFGASLAPLQKQLDRMLAADLRLKGPLPPVLIQGETGTGKTSIARWIHEHGPKSAEPIVEVNCSAMPEPLAESELFGHERGAFTDARQAKMGLFEAANGGTLFLDELPSLSPAIQAKILTVIEDREIRRVGGTKPRSADVRLIAATNQSLKDLVKEGLFREDLYHRLDLYRVEILPLRDRGEDILHLANEFLKGICKRHRTDNKPISNTGERRLLTYRWPGNVRELKHELERAVVFEEGDALEFVHLSEDNPESGTNRDPFEDVFRLPGFSLESSIDRLVDLALSKTSGNVSAAARLLSVPRDYIRYRKGQKNKKPDGK